MSVVHITDKNYNDIVRDGDKPIFIDFYSTYCGPCTELKNFIETNLSKYADERGVLIGICNVSDNPKLSKKFEIELVPFTIAVNKEKKFVYPNIGLKGVEYYYSVIDKLSGKKNKGFFSRLFGKKN